MALTSEREKRICARYSARDESGKVHCDACPLNCDHFDMPTLSCKAVMHYDRRRQEWVYDDDNTIQMVIDHYP